MRAARIGSSRPSSTARSAVAFAIATYDGMVAGAFSAMSCRWACDGLHVTAHDRAGQRGVALGERVVEGGGEQRAQRRGGVLGAGGGQQLHRLADQGDEVVGAVRETGVVERALALGHPQRDAAEVGDQALGVLPLGVAGGHAEHAAGEAVEVELGAGEGHRRVHRDRAGADARSRRRARRGRGGPRCGRRPGPRGSRRRRRAWSRRSRACRRGRSAAAGRRPARRRSAWRARTPGSSVSMRCSEAAESPAAATIS